VQRMSCDTPCDVTPRMDPVSRSSMGVYGRSTIARKSFTLIIFIVVHRILSIVRGASVNRRVVGSSPA
jgi:hypothetical protein